MEKVLHKGKISDQKSADLKFWLSRSAGERIAAVQTLREVFFDETSSGISRVVRIVQQKQS
jgi:hypothetical protein